MGDLFSAAEVMVLPRLAFSDTEIQLVESSHWGSRDQLFDTIVLPQILQELPTL